MLVHEEDRPGAGVDLHVTVAQRGHLGHVQEQHFDVLRILEVLAAVCRGGVDVYFDNTGGPVLEAALSLMNLRGRIVCCGNVSQYDVEKPAPGPMAVPGLVVTKRLRLEGFVVMDFFGQREQAEARLAQWVAEGRIKAIVDIVDGLDKAPQALIGLFEGNNRGKRAVRV